MRYWSWAELGNDITIKLYYSPNKIIYTSPAQDLYIKCATFCLERFLNDWIIKTWWMFLCRRALLLRCYGKEKKANKAGWSWGDDLSRVFFRILHQDHDLIIVMTASPVMLDNMTKIVHNWIKIQSVPVFTWLGGGWRNQERGESSAKTATLGFTA